MSTTTSSTGDRLTLLGGGRMGEALLGGWLAAGRSASSISVVEVVAARADALRSQFPGVAVTNELDGPSDGLVVAVKPADVVPACRAAASAGVRRVLSIAAGVTTQVLAEAVGPGVAVVRAMPNTPALVGAAASAVAPGPGATASDVAWAEDLLAAVGTVVHVPEHQLDAVTGLSGSGPAYVFLVVEALIDAGVLVGLARPVAEALATQLIIGAGALLAGSPDGPAALRAAVTSPGGTTAAGLRELERAGVRAAILDAVAAATERSRELGRPTEG